MKVSRDDNNKPYFITRHMLHFLFKTLFCPNLMKTKPNIVYWIVAGRLIGANIIEERTLTGTAGRWPRDFTNWLFNRGSTVVGLSDMIISEATMTYSFKSCTNTLITVDLEYTAMQHYKWFCMRKMPRCFT